MSSHVVVLVQSLMDVTHGFFPPVLVIGLVVDVVVVVEMLLVVVVVVGGAAGDVSASVSIAFGVADSFFEVVSVDSSWFCCTPSAGSGRSCRSAACSRSSSSVLRRSVSAAFDFLTRLKLRSR